MRRGNEPVQNTPQLMSFQRALEFIKLLKPTREIFLFHIGDGDQVPGDPANVMAKKREPVSPLAPPASSHPYPIPKNQDEWQSVVKRIFADYKLAFKCTVAHDGLTVDLPKSTALFLKPDPVASWEESLDTSKASDAGRRGATSEAYAAIRRNEERTKATPHMIP